MQYLQTFSYNLNVAKKLGVISAVFLSCIYNELMLNESVSLTRDDIFNRTGIDESKQREVEEVLSECGIITVKRFKNNVEKSYYTINESRFISAVENKCLSDILSDFSDTQNVNRKSATKTVTKKSSHIESLKKSIKVADEIIRQYVCDWIESVYANPKGFMSLQSLSIGVQELTAYSSSQEVQIEILKLATMSGYRDITWAIQRYDEKNSSSGSNFVKYSDIKCTDTDMSVEVF